MGLGVGVVFCLTVVQASVRGGMALALAPYQQHQGPRPGGQDQAEVDIWKRA